MRNTIIREYLSIPWIKFLFWMVVLGIGLTLIWILAEYLTKVVFNF